MTIEVMGAGIGCTVQDRGRPGYYNVGIPPSGAVDLMSALAANLLVGNDARAPVLEAPYLGPRLRFTEASVVAVTGADMEPRVNDVPVAAWESFGVSEGDVLSFGLLTAGARVYVAVAGGIDVPEVLGSRSTYTTGGFGGFQGRPIAVGDVLPVGAPGPGARPGRRLPDAQRPTWARDVEVRVVMGLYDYRLTDRGRASFLETNWTLTPVADRMGMRYSGAQLEWQDRPQPFGAGSDPSNIVDAGYPVGSIQVPSGAEPIILHRDAVSGGGYAMVATVISADMDLVGQSAPGTRTKFSAVSLDEAVAARKSYRDRARGLHRLLD
jgi:biotin-dependent carboxylase-like uncharacterized protein